MTSRGNATRFRKRIGDALRPYGWRPSDEHPQVTAARAGAFVRPLENGWFVVLTVRWYDRDEIELPSWRPGTHGVVTVESSAVGPAAERSGSTSDGTEPDGELPVEPRFVVPGQEPGYRQFRGPEDYDHVVAEIVRYAAQILVPTAERDVGTDAWLAAAPAVAAERTALAVASSADVEPKPEPEDPDEEATTWQVVGGLVLIVAVAVFVVGKGAEISGIDIGLSWLPAAAVVALVVIKIGEHSDGLREKWGDRVGSAERVQEYLERRREQREPDEATDETTDRTADEPGPERPND